MAALLRKQERRVTSDALRHSGLLPSQEHKVQPAFATFTSRAST